LVAFLFMIGKSANLTDRSKVDLSH
jgi:hypothetical protein